MQLISECGLYISVYGTSLRNLCDRSDTCFKSVALKASYRGQSGKELL